MNTSEQIFMKHLHGVSVIVDDRIYESIATYRRLCSRWVGFDDMKSSDELVQLLYESKPKLIDELRTIHFDEIRMTIIMGTEYPSNEPVFYNINYYSHMSHLLQNELAIHNTSFVIR
jgi:hypothetical protein